MESAWQVVKGSIYRKQGKVVWTPMEIMGSYKLWFVRTGKKVEDSLKRYFGDPMNAKVQMKVKKVCMAQSESLQKWSVETEN